MTKLQKAKRDDFRLEEELRAAKAKYEESSEDVLRRMQDIQDAEADSVRDLTQLVNAELDYHERCAQELRRVRQNWPAAPSAGQGYSPDARRPALRSRSNTAHSFTEPLARTATYGSGSDSPPPPPVRMPSIRPGNARMQSSPSTDAPPVRPMIGRANTVTGFQGGASLNTNRSSCTPTPLANNVGALRGQLRPVSRIVTTRENDDVFADAPAPARQHGEYYDDTASESGSGSPGAGAGGDWGNRSSASSVATSVASLSRTSSNNTPAVRPGGAGVGLGKKAPPPPPPSRAKKPAPPVPVRRGELGY